jgi:tetratricopeptide (TPR) repeat protein
MDAPAHDSAPPALERSRRAHEAFAASRRNVYVRDDAAFATLDDFVTRAETERTLLVTAESGAGKSALLANWIDSRRRRNPETFIVEYYVSAASSRSDHLDILQNLFLEIACRVGDGDAERMSIEQLEESLPLWLARLRDDRAVIVLDGLDQLDVAAQDLRWLPAFLPTHVRMIVSATPGSPAAQRLLGRTPLRLELPPLERARRAEIARRFLRSAGLRPPPADVDRIVDAASAANPLFLYTSVSSLARDHGAHVAERVDYFLGASNLSELFTRVIARAEEDHDPVAVRDILTSIAAARRGIALHELAGMLEAPHTAIERTLGSIDFHVSKRGGLLTFTHDHMRAAITARYLRDDDDRRAAHRRFGAYLSTKPLDDRVVDELPWQWMQAAEWESLRATLAERRVLRSLSDEESQIELLRYWRALDERASSAATYLDAAGRWLDSSGSSGAVDDVVLAADLLTRRGEYEAAHDLYERARELCDEAGRPKLLHRLGTVAYHRGQLETAQALFEQGLAEMEATDTSAERLRCDLTIDLGAVVYGKGMLDRAIGLFEQARQGASRMRDTAREAQCLNNLASAYAGSGNLDAAAEALRAAIELNRARFGDEHPELARNLTNLGIVECRLRQLDAALEHGRWAVEILRSTLGRNHASTANALQNLANTYREYEDLESAEECSTEALEILRIVHGGKHVDVARALAGLAAIRHLSARPETAEDAYVECLSIRTEILGESHPDTVRIRRYLDEYRDNKRRSFRRLDSGPNADRDRVYL